ncbi:MAG: single-stranded DNA-binding protein [Planctomycetota bacterium]
MPSYNKVILMGNFTRDPELRYLPNNTPVSDFGLAINDRFLNKNTNQWEDRANFVDCTAFGRTAENITKFFAKGRPIFIEGKLRFEQWEDRQSGQKRSKLKVVIDSWQFVDSKNEAGGNGGGGGGGYQDGGRNFRSKGYGNEGGGGNQGAANQAGGGWDDGGGHEAVDEDDIPF